jgi:solute carrier family 39 (zinc transporter), member 7
MKKTRTLKEETNPHKVWIQKIMQMTKLEELMNKMDTLIRPLPDTVQALISTLFISVVPIFFIYLLNLLFLSKPSLRDTLIYYLISFAVGGLLGDVFFHTLPHLGSSSGGSSHSHDHSHGHGDDHSHGSDGGHSHDPAQMAIYGIVIAGIVSFFLIEKIVTNYLGGDGHDHSHSHAHHHDHSKNEHKQVPESAGDKKSGKKGLTSTDKKEVTSVKHAEEDN